MALGWIVCMRIKCPSFSKSSRSWMSDRHCDWPVNTKSVICVFTISLWAGMATAVPAEGLNVRVDISDQLMVVSRDEKAIYSWPISTGGAGYRTPTGVFHPVRMHETWYSVKYDGVPMPNSIFFFRGYAIHGTLDIRSLGRPASRGCVRLLPQHAKVLFDLVKKQGFSRTEITVQE